jgi:anti-anti-sigma regulatory factor
MVKLAIAGQSLRLEGRLDIQSVKKAHESLKALNVKPQQLDAKGLEGLDTAGVQWLLWWAKQAGGPLEVTGASKSVAATLTHMGLGDWVKS